MLSTFSPWSHSYQLLCICKLSNSFKWFPEQKEQCVSRFFFFLNCWETALFYFNVFFLLTPFTFWSSSERLRLLFFPPQNLPQEESSFTLRPKMAHVKMAGEGEYLPFNEFSVVQLLSHARLFVTPWTAACQASLSFTISQSLPKLMSFVSMMPRKVLSSV